MNQTEIKKFLDSEVGQGMKEYLLLKLWELKSIDNIKRYKTEKAQIIEVDSQQKAYDKLKDILDYIATISDADIKKSEKDSYWA